MKQLVPCILGGAVFIITVGLLTLMMVCSFENHPNHKTTHEVNAQRDRMEEKLDQLIELGEKWQ